MEIRLSRHARLRVAQRFVDAREIRVALEDPDDVRIAADGERVHHLRQVDARTLDVVARRHANGWLVVTLIWDIDTPRSRRARREQR